MPKQNHKSCWWFSFFLVITSLCSIGCSPSEPTPTTLKVDPTSPAVDVASKTARLDEVPTAKSISVRDTEEQNAGSYDAPKASNTELAEMPDRSSAFQISTDSEYVVPDSSEIPDRSSAFQISNDGEFVLPVSVAVEDTFQLNVDSNQDLPKLLSKIAQLKQGCRFQEAEEKCLQAYSIAIGNKDQNPAAYLDVVTELLELRIINHKLIEAMTLQKQIHSTLTEKVGRTDSALFSRYQDLVIRLFVDIANQEILLEQWTVIENEQELIDPDVLNFSLLQGIIAQRQYEFKEAKILLDKGLAQAEARFGKQDVRYAEALVMLADYYNEIDNLPLAEQQLEAAIDIYEEQPDRFHRDYLRALCLYKQASYYFEREIFQKSEPLCLESCEILRRCVGPNHPAYADALWLKGKLAVSKGCIPAVGIVAEIAREVVTIYDEWKTGSSFDLCEFAFELEIMVEYHGKIIGVLLYEKTGNFSDEEFSTLSVKEPRISSNLERFYKCHTFATTKELSNYLDLWAEKKDVDYRLYSKCLDRLAMRYASENEQAKAIATYQKSLSVRERIWGPNHYLCAQSLKDLSYVHSLSGDYFKSLEFASKRVKMIKCSTGEESVAFANSMRELGSCYVRLQMFEQAAFVLAQSIEIREPWLIKESTELHVDAGSFALLASEVGKHEQAEQLLDHAQANFEEVLGKESFLYLNSLGVLGKVKLNQGYDQQAEALLSEAVRGLRKLGEENKPDRVYEVLLLRLGNLHIQNGKLNKAKPLLEEAQPLAASWGKKHPFYSDMMDSWGKYYLAQGENEKALSSFIESHEIREFRYGEEHPLVSESLESIAEVRKQLQP